MPSGPVRSGPRSLELGLIDGIADVRSKMRSLFGAQTRLRVVPLQSGGLLGRLRRLPGLAGIDPTTIPDATVLPFSLGNDLISSVEARALWRRFGL